ncbi:RTT109 family histone lysine acetyltransferase [Schizosaccharomyces japonicus yFS275]|uniref:histone acetyltransferase n=1 Tax=Schizosaccharomyces japonicus (strain yFS275 / FY16936) TaxID=402676 RepID=B6K015_SCHJY|nr:RTT109 family histone lysine acetyltransferase [Schizosaccharomyces japonicus yFS275]EEB06165.1 RTT109 family histone lysine acetyltransferase [Schizosaccharomyces japonicus yFS275]
MAELSSLLAANIAQGDSVDVVHLRTKFTPCKGLFGEKAMKSDETHNASASNHLFLLSQDHLFVFGLEIIVYDTQERRYIFVSKADSTGFQTSKLSVLRPATVAILLHLVHSEHVRPVQAKETVICFFAISQGQYLFPESANNGKKHVCSDTDLVKWWVKVLESVRKQLEDNKVSSVSKEPQQKPRKEKSLEVKVEESVTGHLYVPGFTNLKQFFPNEFWFSDTVFDNGTATKLIPRFPDDPKARYLDELELQNDDMQTDKFWETLSFRQECCSGKLVAFFSLCIPQVSTVSKPSGLLVGPKLYQKMYSQLLQYSFVSPAVTKESTLGFLGSLQRVFARKKGEHFRVYETINGCNKDTLNETKPLNKRNVNSDTSRPMNVLIPRKKQKTH